MNQPDFLSQNTPQDPPQPEPKASAALRDASEMESLKAMLQALEIPHAFDIEAIGLEEKDIAAMISLLHLDQKIQTPGFAWSAEDGATYKDMHANIHQILEQFTTVPSDSNEGSLMAFLRNKLAEIDFVAAQNPK